MVVVDLWVPERNFKLTPLAIGPLALQPHCRGPPTHWARGIATRDQQWGSCNNNNNNESSGLLQQQQQWGLQEQ